MKEAVIPSVKLSTLLMLASLALGKLIMETQFFDLRSIFICLTVILQLYLFYEIYLLKKLHPQAWLLNPVVLCSIVTFTLAFGVSNVVFFLPEESLKIVGLMPVVTPAMNQVVWLAVIGAVAMWSGYRSYFANKLIAVDFFQSLKRNYFTADVRIKSWALPLMFGIAVATRLMAIQLGIYGYSGSIDQFAAAASYLQYVNYGANIGKVALVIVALDFFSKKKNQKTTLWFFILLSTEVFFGLLSGFKSAVAMPFLIVVLCKYIRTNRVDRFYVSMFIVSLSLSYVVIEPFRAAKITDKDFDGTSLSYISTTLLTAAFGHGDTSITLTNQETASILLSIFARNSLTSIAAVGVDYAEANPKLPDDSPGFLSDIVLAPVYALVPRFIWSGKVLGNIGLWYTKVVLNFPNSNSSTAMSPIAYLNFAGGAIAVYLGFFLLGIFHRFVWALTTPTETTAGALVFLSMLGTLAIVNSAYYPIIISMCRDLPLVILLQKYLFLNEKY